LLLPPAMLLSRRLELLRLGVDSAASLGVPVRATQWTALLLAVLMAGLAVGVCGPIAFVALAAPFIACRRRIAVGSAALAGALLVAAADTVGRIVLDGAELPAGVICNLLGGPFLLWILLTERSGESD
jgi:iron complex transport system permease protein